VSNYRVRQVLRLHLPQRQEHFLLGLATFLPDDTRTALAGFDAITEAAAQARNTARTARRELEKDGKLASRPTGVGRGHVTEWTALCLPEVSPESQKGVSAVNPVSAVDPLPDEKGVKPSHERGSNAPEKGGQGRRSDQQQADTLNRLAKPSGSHPVLTVGETVRAAVADATDEEIDEFAKEVITERAPGDLGTPASVTCGALCRRCGRPGHTKADCPTLADPDAAAPDGDRAE
jgi:hypothetical protein